METGRKNKEKEYIETIDDLFGEDEKPVERLGQGIHNGVFYYAVSVKGLPVIITSEREYFRKYYKDMKNARGKTETICIDEIKNNFQLNYMTDFDGNAVDTKWELTDIHRYLKSKNKKVELSELIEKIYDINKSHVHHINDEYHLLVAYYILYTYAFALFEFAPRLNFFAMTSSGKSTQLKIIKYTKFNPLWISKSSTSGIYRSVESTCGIPCIDNFDKINEDLKKDTFHFIEIAFDREGVLRLSEASGRGWKTKKYAAFCPLEITSTMPFSDDAVDNRAILLRMEKTTRKITKLNTKDKKLREIRNESRLFVLTNYKKIIDTAVEVSKENRINSRTLDIWQGILTFAKMNNQEDYNTLVTLAKNLEKESKQVNSNEELPKVICILLLNKFSETEKTIEVDLTKFVSEVLMHELNVDETSSLVKSRHRYYLKATRNTLQAFPGLWNAKNLKNTHNRIKFTITEEKVLETMKMRGYDIDDNNEKLEKKEIILTSNNQLNQLNQTNLSSPEFNKKNTRVVVNNSTTGLAEVKTVKTVKIKNGRSKKVENSQLFDLGNQNASNKENKKKCDDCGNSTNQKFEFKDGTSVWLCENHLKEARESGF